VAIVNSNSVIIINLRPKSGLWWSDVRCYTWPKYRAIMYRLSWWSTLKERLM